MNMFSFLFAFVRFCFVVGALLWFRSSFFVFLRNRRVLYDSFAFRLYFFSRFGVMLLVSLLYLERLPRRRMTASAVECTQQCMCRDQTTIQMSLSVCVGFYMQLNLDGKHTASKCAPRESGHEYNESKKGWKSSDWGEWIQIHTSTHTSNWILQRKICHANVCRVIYSIDV